LGKTLTTTQLQSRL